MLLTDGTGRVQTVEQLEQTAAHDGKHTVFVHYGPDTTIGSVDVMNISTQNYRTWYPLPKVYTEN